MTRKLTEWFFLRLPSNNTELKFQSWLPEYWRKSPNGVYTGLDGIRYIYSVGHPSLEPMTLNVLYIVQLKLEIFIENDNSDTVWILGITFRLCSALPIEKYINRGTSGNGANRGYDDKGYAWRHFISIFPKVFIS